MKVCVYIYVCVYLCILFIYLIIDLFIKFTKFIIFIIYMYIDRYSLLRGMRSICPWVHHSTGKNSPRRRGADRRNGPVAAAATAAAETPNALCTTGAEAAVASMASVSAASSGASWDMGEGSGLMLKPFQGLMERSSFF
jgi:hypothetical protein